MATGSLRSHPSPASSDSVRHYSPSGRRGVPTRWTACKLDELQRAYHSNRRMKVIAHEFSTSESTIHRFARRLGWKRRRTRQAEKV